MKIKLTFKTTLPQLIKKFLFCTDNLDNYKEYVQLVDTSTEGRNFFLEEELTEKGWSLLRSHLVNTETPHKQMRKMIIINFEIYGITRALLQEWSKHQIGIASVAKSTRFTLGKIAKDKRIIELNGDIDVDNLNIDEIVKDYYYIPNTFKEEHEKDIWINDRYMELAEIKYQKLNNKLSNDKLKKYINEYMLCNISGIMSGEALHNLLLQRLDVSAYYQFQDLAKKLYKKIPDEWKEFFKVYKYKKVKVNKYTIEYLKSMINKVDYFHLELYDEIQELIDKLENNQIIEKISLVE